MAGGAESIRAASTRAADAEALGAYIPRLVVEWLAHEPQRTHRQVTGTCVFADISGFTALTERLAERDKAGAEEMGDLLNDVFDPLLTAAYDYGANLVKWGGDAVLLLFDGEQHAARATRAAWAMQSTIKRIGNLQTSRGSVRLRMSIGVHSDDFDFLLVGHRYRELIVTGPAATTTAAMEKAAAATQVMISPQCAAQLPPASAEEGDGPGLLLLRPPDIALSPNRTRKPTDVDLGQAFCAPLRDHLRSGEVDHEHRQVTVAFIEFSGTDALRREAGLPILDDAVAMVIEQVQDAAYANSVTVLSTDICEDGGKIILVAGAPSTAGDDETRVISAVRRIMTAGAGLLGLRAGITRGRVFAGNYGPSYRRVYSVTGDIVNLAARLMSHADPGQILALPDVLERCRTPFHTRELPPFTVKGKAEPIRALAVEDAATMVIDRDTGKLPLDGRADELSLLAEAAADASAGRGRVIEICGPPGIGKSRLIDEAVDASGMRELRADGDVYARATAYQPMQMLLRRTLGMSLDVDREIVAAAITELVRTRAPDLLPWLPLIAVVAGVSVPSTPEVDILDPDARKTRIRTVTSDLLGRLLTEPTVLVVNDVHYMDDATVEFVKQLIDDTRRRPWLMLITRRPDVPSIVAPGSHALAMQLAPLDDSAAARLIETITQGVPLPAHRVRQLIERAGGNPLFLQALLAGAAAGEDIDTLPDSVEGVLAAHIDRLVPVQRRWLRSASVLGMIVDPALLDEIMESSTLTSTDIADLSEFIRPGPDGNLQFAHHLVQLTAYEGLPYRQRRTLHARAANALERRAGARVDQFADLLSVHCLRGERYEAAWQYARLAGREARDRYALVEAAACYARALDSAAQVTELPLAEVADVCETVADIHFDLGDMVEAERSLEQARRRATTDPRRLARLRLKTARQRHRAGRHSDALRWISRGRELLETDTDQVAIKLRAELAAESAMIRYDQGAYKVAMKWARTSIEEARLAGDRTTEASGMGVLAVLSSLSGLPWDDDMARASLELAEAAGDLRGKAVAANRIGMCTYFAGRWDEAVRYYEEARAAFERIGYESGAAMAAANRAEVFVQQGRAMEALTILEPLLQVWRAAHDSSFLAFGMTLCGRASLGLGLYTQARDYLHEAAALCREMGETDDALTAEAILAECLLEEADPAAALAAADETLHAAGRDGLSADALLHRVRGRALTMLGQAADGREALLESLAAARHRDASHEVEASLWALLEHDAARSGGAASIESLTWEAERTRLATNLGIVDRAVVIR